MNKKFSLSLLAVLLLLVATPSLAATTTVTELFGKWKFTATVDVTEAGKAYKDHFSADCEVVISKATNNIFEAQIKGFAGADGTENIMISSFSSANQTLTTKNPSGANYGVFSSQMYFSNAEGIYPFGETPIGDYVFTISEDGKTITSPDFTLIGNCDYSASTCDILVKFSNVKMVLVEAEVIDIADISGNWSVKAGAGQYDSKEDSPLPASYTMKLTQNGDNKSYKGVFTIEGIEPFELEGKFDGNALTFPIDGNVIDKSKGYKLTSMYNSTKANISFVYSSETTMLISNPLVVSTIETKEENGEETTTYNFIQWYLNGSAKKTTEAGTFSWAGKFSCHTDNYLDFSGGSDILQKEGEAEIQYWEAIDAYYITKIFGYDLYNLNGGGMKLTISSDDPKKAEASLTGAYGSMYLTSTNGIFYKITDASGNNNPLKLSINEDGSITIDDFYVLKGNYTEETTWVAGYNTNKLTPVKEEENKDPWAGSFVANAKVTKYVDGDYPTTFDIVIDPTGDYGQFITTFISPDVKSANYGGIKLVADEKDANKAVFASDKFVKTITPGEKYWKIKDMNGSNGNITMTRNLDGSISISSFSLFEITYDASFTETSKCLALYENVTATVGSTGIKNTNVVEKPQFKVVGNNITFDKEENVVVTDLSGRIIFSGKTQTVSGLCPGVVIIRTANAAAKCTIK